MTDALLLTRRSRAIQLQRNLLLVVRTILSYLGVAVLVTALMVISVPSVRDQVAMMNRMVISTLTHDGARVDPVQAIDPATVAPQVSPVDIGELPARDLAQVEPEVVEEESGRTEALGGELGNTEIDRIETAMAHFSLTRKQLDAVEAYIARKYRVGRDVVHRLTESVLVSGHELNVHPLLILAVMSIESRFNPYAESGAGAQGLMQVMSRVHQDKFEALGETQEAAFHPQHNIYVGTRILHDCIKRRGSVVNGLKCYVGATGPNDGGYSNRVLAERRRMALAGNVKITD